MTGTDHHFKPLKYIHPKYLFTWIGLLFMWLTSLLSYGAMIRLGTILGWFSFYLMSGRRRITRTNIRLCFPELDEPQLRQLTKQNFYDSSIALLESPQAWWGSDRKLKPLHRIEGLEHLEAAKAKGKGVIMLGAHYTTLEISGRLLSFHIDFHATYKRAHNELFNAVMTRSRSRVHGGLLNSSDMRGILRYLGENGTIWFAPDQDFGRKGSVFAPFMGVTTASLMMTSRLAKKSGATVIPMYSERLPGKEGYLIRLGAALNIPSGDDVTDATTVNRAIEEQIRRTPAQYLWGHRRFKTRPYGEPLIYAPRKNSALKKYDLLMMLLSLPLILYTLWMALRCRDMPYLLQRLGLQMPKQDNYGLWIHAASVGEVNAVMPLIKALHHKYPHMSITLTTATPTGGQMARSKLPDGCVQHYLPLDWSWALRRLLNRLQPRNLFIMETELWPKLIWNCYCRNIPLIIINGRLSHRSQPKSKWLKTLYMLMMQQTYFVLARSQLDADRFVQAGIESERIKVMGNIKFNMDSATVVKPVNLGRSYVLVASSRDDEEWRIVEAWQKAEHDNTLLVIVPRHPKRMETICKQLKHLNGEIAIRSKGEKVTDSTQIYLADTFGELSGFIAGSEFVIMGGSFVPLGGQNILEVGQQGKAVVFGPHMDNFKDEAALFVEHEAGLQLADTAALPEQIERLLQDSKRCQQLGQNGQRLLQSYSHIIDDYVTELEQLSPDLLNQENCS